MKTLLYTPVVLSLLVLGAHFMRDGNEIGVATALVLIGLLFLRRPWVARVIQGVLVLGALEWIHTLYRLTQARLAHDMPVTRMAIILGAVAVVAAGSALLFQTRTMKDIYGLGEQ